MEWFLAPSLVQLRDEINVEWPNRDKASDGSIGNAEHSARVSDHNPDDRGMVHAIDIDRDGINVDLILSNTIGDHRVNYVIYNKQIWSRVRDFRAIPYNGVNAHKSHIHVSILYTEKAETDKSLWLQRIKPQEEEVEFTKDIWNAEVALTETDAKVWTEYGKATGSSKVFHKGDPVKYSDMVRYPTLARKNALALMRIEARLDKDAE
jgi:hypothetical protein